ncbi:helix-turn-helix transcriptional regulator [Paenibacillus nanensis]|uniref:helix-turn-helix transcriptional regulator n=1 Tax=Paenibacillus nanensis TaxID=393251 RepID=UPI0013C2A874|nr:YafY family protein [Paenibacillus nanensis]
MNKTQRLIRLMLTINDKRKFTLGELAAEFGVSKKTVWRDLQDLSELGVPVYSELGSHGGYSVLHSRMLPPIIFSEEEAISVFFASQSLLFYRSLPFSQEMSDTLNKLHTYLPEDVREKITRLKDRLLFWVPTNVAESPFLQDLLLASMDQSVIEITHESESGVSVRNILPIGIYTINGHWYCPAYCYERNGYRTFRADRILAVRRPSHEIEPVTHPYGSVQDWLFHHFSDQEGVELVVRLTRKGLLRCRTDFWLSEGITEHPEGGGILRKKMSHSQLSWAAEYFCGMGQEAVVEQPQELIEQIKARVRGLSRQYGITNDG